MLYQREAIIGLHKSGKSVAEIVRLLGAPRSSVYKTVKRFKELGTSLDYPRSGRPATVNVPKVRKHMRQLLRRNPNRSMRSVASTLGISRESARKIAKDKLKLKPYKVQKVQLLTPAQQQARLRKAKALLKRFGHKGWDKILFTDEKVFTVAQHFNRQNDRYWLRNKHHPGRFRKHVQKPISVMIWAGMTAEHKTPIHIVAPGVKVNKEYYCSQVLEAVVQPWAAKTFGDQPWTFQQDSAPSHASKATMQWLKSNFLDVISPDEWPSSSPDLNPMDFSIWAILEQKACSKPHRSLAALINSLKKAWAEIPQEVLRAAAESFLTRLRKVVKAKGGYIEHE